MKVSRQPERGRNRTRPTGDTGRSGETQGQPHAPHRGPQSPRQCNANSSAQIDTRIPVRRSPEARAKRPVDKPGSGQEKQTSWKRRQNRKSAGKKQPFPAQIFEHSRRRRRFCNHDNPRAGRHLGEGMTNQLTDPPANTIPDNRTTHPPRGNDPNPGRRLISRQQKTDADELSLHGPSPLANPRKLRPRRQPGGFSKLQRPTLRLRCGGRNGSRHPSEGDVCGRAGGGGSMWHGRPWSPCGRENQTAACASSSRAGRCVS